MNHANFDKTTQFVWLAALATTSLTLIAESTLPVLNPLVAPYLCAAAIGTKLPPRQLALLTFLLVGAMLFPMLAYSADAQQWTHRCIGAACVWVITSMRLIPAAKESIDQVREFEEALVSDLSLSSATSTEIRATHHQYQSGLVEDLSFDRIASDDHLAPILKQLEKEGTFDNRQMQLIESAMRTVEGQSVNLDLASAIETGQRIGRSIVVGLLGRGGEGQVYRGHDLSGNPAAIKILHNMRVSDRFRREMHMVRQLAHPNIVTAYEVGEYRGLPFITMELLKGPDLYAQVRDSGCMPWKVCTQYILQAARALAHAHQRDLVHRDIKPGNLILHGDQTIKLVDLGLAAMPSNDASMDSVFQFETQEGHLAGTLPYMAPEQARSLANATIQSDIYGLGATWFYLLTGRERLRGKSFSMQFENLLVRRRFNALRPGLLPEPLEKVYKRMVAYSPIDRHEDCEQLAEDLEQALEQAGELVVMVEGINVLVVEDSRTDMILTIDLLRRTNSTLSIQQARSLSEGMRVCHETEIDLVLLDLSLPDSGGVGTVHRFRESFGSVPLVVLTGLTQDEAGEDCLDAGADGFLSKSGLSAHRMERAIFVTLSRCGMTGQAGT